MTAAANRILAVLVLGLAGAALPMLGESLNRESDRTGTFLNRFSLGVLGGANQGAGGPRTFLETRPTSVVGTQPAGWVVGAFLETDLGARFSAQAGVSIGHLYGWNRHEFEQEVAGPLGLTAVTYSLQPTRRGEIPVTLNYRLGPSKWRPVIGGGLAWSGTYGAVAQFGLERQVRRRLTVAPQVRYFRWTKGPEDRYLFFRPPNQIQVLVALTF